MVELIKTVMFWIMCLGWLPLIVFLYRWFECGITKVDENLRYMYRVGFKPQYKDVNNKLHKYFYSYKELYLYYYKAMVYSSIYISNLFVYVILFVNSGL